MRGLKWNFGKMEAFRANGSYLLTPFTNHSKAETVCSKRPSYGLTRKLIRNCWIFIALKKMVSLLLSTHFRRFHFNGCTRFALSSTYIFDQKESKLIGSFDFWRMKQKPFSFFVWIFFLHSRWRFLLVNSRWRGGK